MIRPPLPSSSASPRVYAGQRKTGPAAFTLFELLAVLTVIGILLVSILGAYGSWGTAHALAGATRTVEAGLEHARTLAVSRRVYVAVSYGTTNNALSRTTGFQSFFCTNNNDTAVSETDLKILVQALTDTAFLSPDDTNPSGTLVIEPATSFQRLSNHVRLSRRQTLTGTHYTTSLLIFRPDGSILTDDGITPSAAPQHTLALETAESFPVPDSTTDTAPLVRLFRIDPATGLATVFGDTP